MPVKPTAEFSAAWGYAAGEERKMGDNAFLPDALYGDSAPCPTHELRSESAKHRRVVMLAIGGLTNIEIGEIVGYAPEYVSDVLRQPFARQRIIAAAKEESGDLKALLAKEGLNCLKNLIAVANRTDIKPADYITANAKVVDRWLGKETQVFTINDSKPEELPDDDLDRRIRERLDAATSRGN